MLSKIKLKKEENNQTDIVQANPVGGLQQVINVAVNDNAVIQASIASPASSAVVVATHTDVPLEHVLTSIEGVSHSDETEISTTKLTQSQDTTSPTKPVAHAENILNIALDKMAVKKEKDNIPALSEKSINTADNMNESILEQTKSTLHKIMNKLKVAKEKASALVAGKSHVADKNIRTAALDSNVPAFNKNATKNSIQVIGTLSDISMKVNPVVALSIGKEASESDIDNKQQKYTVNRKKFSSVAQDEYKPETTIVTDIALPVNKDIFVSDTVAATISSLLPSPISTTQEIHLLLPSDENKQNVLVEMVSLSDVFSGTSSNLLPQKAIVTKNINSNYVFPKGRFYTQKSGIVGKSMFYNKKQGVVPDKPANLYVFVATPHHIRPFSGETRKRGSLFEI